MCNGNWVCARRSPTAFVLGRGVDLEAAVAVKDLAAQMDSAVIYKEGGCSAEHSPNYLKLTDVDEVRGRHELNSVRLAGWLFGDVPRCIGVFCSLFRRFVTESPSCAI